MSAFGQVLAVLRYSAIRTPVIVCFIYRIPHRGTVESAIWGATMNAVGRTAPHCFDRVSGRWLTRSHNNSRKNSRKSRFNKIKKFYLLWTHQILAEESRLSVAQRPVIYANGGARNNLPGTSRAS